jgi:VanZ family protein
VAKKLFWIWWIILLLLNVIPLGNEVNARLKTGLGMGELRSDYLVHALTFVCFAGIYAVKLMRREMIFKARELIKIISIIITSAILFEAVQYMLPYRTWNLRDLVANLIGAGIASGFMYMMSQRQKT